MLNVERLRVLHAVARYGSVGGAAEALHVTTAAISQQLAKLEREAKQPLLSRHGRGIRLTDAGRLLAGHADTILSDVAKAEADLAAHLGEVRGELSIAAFATAVRGLLPQALTALRRDHPLLRPRLSELDPERAIARLVRGDLDIALVILHWENKPMTLPAELRSASLLNDPADLVLPSGHRLADRDVIDLCELGDDDWIAWPDGEMCQEWLMHTLRSNGIEPRIAHTAGEHQTQLALVAAGFGVAIMPRLGRGEVPDGVTTVPLTDRLSRHVSAVWRADSHRQPSIQAALSCLRAGAVTAAA